MQSYFYILLFLILSIPFSYAQKGTFFGYWGYNRANFSRSTIHFQGGADYDFTVFRVSARDRPTPFEAKSYLNPLYISIPQNNYRVGYFLNNRLHLSFGNDHMKYVVQNGQNTTLSGNISAQFSHKYAGSYLNEPINLSSEFLKFEHTNGLNLMSVELGYLMPLLESKDKKWGLGWNTMAGIGALITKTDVSMMGSRTDNRFHFSGYAPTIGTGLRATIFRHYFADFSFKAGYAHLPDVLLENSSPKRANHSFTFVERFLVAGGVFKL